MNTREAPTVERPAPTPDPPLTKAPTPVSEQAATNNQQPAPSRYAEVARVLIRVFALNLAVALAKIIFGYSSGTISVLSDGFHSLTDGASNVVGLVGVYAARQPPDADHPYGHRKYETVAAAAVTLFLLLVVIEVLRNALNYVTGRAAPPSISTAAFGVMFITVAINLLVVPYESREAPRLGPDDHVFLDLHVWLPGDLSLTDAHRLSHDVKDRLMARYPQIVDAVIHIEPPPRSEQASGPD